MPSPAQKVADPRGGVRSNVFLSAALQTASGSFPVRVRNLSVRGALLDGVDLPGEGTAVRLRRGHLEVGGEVAWRSDRHRGLYFDDDIDVAGWVKGAFRLGQERIDRVVQTFRHSPEAVSDLACSGEMTLQSLSAELGEVCESLAARADLQRGAADDLLRLDAVAQRIREWAGERSAEGRSAASP